MHDSSNVVFSIGHSNNSMESFCHLLNAHRIQYLLDVRSSPYSKMYPQYCRESLEMSVKTFGVNYLFFGREFGARISNPALLTNGRVDFSLVIQSPHFLAGVARVAKAVKSGYRVALMCAEANPLDCHRFSMVSRGLMRHQVGASIGHILKDGLILSQEAAEKSLIASYKDLPVPDQQSLFDKSYTYKKVLEMAYINKNTEIGYSADEEHE